MKIIKPNVIELKQTDLFKHIELCGRTCYKSEDKITDDSAEKFVNMLRSHAHGAMLEHGTVYLTIPFEVDDYLKIERIQQHCTKTAIVNTFRENKYSQVIAYGINFYITTNYRFIVENGWEDVMQEFQSECTKYHPKRRTFKITCNRGVSHEFVRHRVFSVAQELQHYYLYNKDGQGNEVTFVEPIWQENSEYMTERTLKAWTHAMDVCESTYFDLLIAGLTPQLARGVLPNDIKTELIMTGFEADWDNLFELKSAPDAHPEVKYLADLIKEQF